MARAVISECRDCRAAGRHWIGASTVALLGATAVVFAIAAAVLAEPVTSEDDALATETLVRRYYAAVNTALATGEFAMVEALVAAEAPPTPEAADPASARSTLVERLTAVRAAHPELHLRVERVVANRDEAVAWVSLEGIVVSQPMSMPPGGDEAGLLDGFQVQDGQITEVWGATVGLSAPEPVIQADFEAGSRPVFTGLVRVEVDPGAVVPPLSGPGPAAIAVESGSMWVVTDRSGRLTRNLPGGGTATEQIAPGKPASLGPGDQLTLAAGMPFRLRNDGDEATAALLAVVFPPSVIAAPAANFTNAGLEVRSPLVEWLREPNGVSDGWWPPGVTVQRLVGEVLADEAACPLRLDVQRMVLAPGADMAHWRPSGHAVLVAEHGTVLITTDQAAGSEAARPELITGDGEAIVIAPGAHVSARGSGDDQAEVILVSLQGSAATSFPDGRVQCAI